MNDIKKIAIFASHNASSLEPIYNAIQEKTLNISIEILISNNTNAFALQKAKELNIKSKVINSKKYENVDERIYKTLKENSCQYIFLAGYMKKISSLLTNNFIIINSHPSLLPLYGGAGMYGRFVHEAVLKNNEKFTGVSIHYVNEHYDQGKILLQEKLEILPNEKIDSLEQRVKKLEAVLIIKTLKLCLK